MIWGTISGAIFGVIYYILRRGGVQIARDAQSGLHWVAIMAVLHAIVPAIIGALIGWAVT